MQAAHKYCNLVALDSELGIVPLMVLFAQFLEQCCQTRSIAVEMRSQQLQIVEGEVHHGKASRNNVAIDCMHSA